MKTRWIWNVAITRDCWPSINSTASSLSCMQRCRHNGGCRSRTPAWRSPPTTFSDSNSSHRWKACSRAPCLRTNRWGLHDKEYALEPPPGCYRIAMIGASISMGTGVERDTTFEAILEDRLNRENGGTSARHYEILNFSVWAYRAIQQIAVLEQKVLPFKPNAVFYIEHPGDTRRVIINLAEAISHETPLPYSFVRDLCDRAHVNSRVPEPIIRRRLQPHALEILAWVYDRMVADCRANNIQPVFVSLPPVGPEQEKPNIELAKSAGFSIVDLTGVYEGRDWTKLILSQWDSHPTPEGHQLVAERLYQELRKTGVIPLPSRVDSSPPLKAE